jgi:aquaporin TIP
MSFDMSAEGLGLRAEDINRRTLVAALAELIAVMLFVFIGAGTVVVVLGAFPENPAADTLLAIAVAHGLAIGVLVAMTAGISGGHVNPAVTFSMIVTGRQKLGPGLVYIAAQLIGAVIGALLLQIVLADDIEGNLGAHALNESLVDGSMGGLIVEIILTFVLVATVFGTAVHRAGPAAIAPIAIGFSILIDHLIGVPLTGASMNPARSFGPALVAGEWDDFWIYVIGPLVGAAIAGLLYTMVFMDPDND